MLYLKRVMYTAPKWQRLIYMLETITSNEEAIASKSHDAIMRWNSGFNRSYSLPSESQTKRIHELIDGLNGALQPQLQKELLFTLP